jgi:hypothetical protein
VVRDADKLAVTHVARESIQGWVFAARRDIVLSESN